jgi:hypothetical protein
MAVRYVSNADGKGWLKVKWDSDGSLFPPLPYYLKVDHQGVAANRDRFVVSEGLMTGKSATVALKPDGTSYLVNGNPPTTGPARVKFDRTTGKVTWSGGGPISAIAVQAPLPAGTYDLELPYEAHPGGAGYEDQSIYAKTWFRIGHSGDHFLHPGAHSLGCVTVTEVQKWTGLYDYLIKSRAGDGQNVGTIEIV